jgi:hypothetical protein
LLGSDLVYSREAVTQLLALLPSLLAPGGVFFYVAPETNRLGEVEFLDGMANLGFARSEAPVPPRYLSNVLGEATDEDFGIIFPELGARTYTLYTFFRGGEAVPDLAVGGAKGEGAGRLAVEGAGKGVVDGVGGAAGEVGVGADEGGGMGAEKSGGAALGAGVDELLGLSGGGPKAAGLISPGLEPGGSAAGVAGGGHSGGFRGAIVGEPGVCVQLSVAAVGPSCVRVRVRAC